MAQTFEQLKQAENARDIFNQVKNDGYNLLQEGQIDAKTYYAKTRQAGIELGLIDEDDYPGRLPTWVEPTLEILGGTAGAVGGFFVGGPVGAAAGAGGGAASGSLAADFLGDLLAPDMPAPSTEDRIKDAAITGTVDAALTLAAPIVGKSLKPIITKTVDKYKAAKETLKKTGPDGEARVNLAERALGLTDEALEDAKKLADEGVPLSLGQASSSPFVRGMYTAVSRMPIVGAPGQKQLLETFEAVDKALNNRIAPTAKIKPLTETERSELIQNFGMQSFNNWRSSYKSVYKRAEKEARNQGDFFDVNPLRVAALRNMPRSEFEKMPKEIQDLMLDINLYGDFLVGAARRPDALKKMTLNFDDIEALDFRLKDLSKKYDPAKSATPNNRAYQAVTAMQKEMKQQLRNPETTHGRLYSAGDRLFKEYMSVVEGKTGKEFQKALTRGALRPGVGRPASLRLEDLYKKTFGDAKSPGAVDDLRKLVGDRQMNVLAANYLDDVFTKYYRGDKRDFDGLFKELGFDNLKGKNYEATKRLLKNYKSAERNLATGKLEIKSVEVDDLYRFMSILKEFPEAVPDVNTFIVRSAALRAASNLGPTAIIGGTGLTLSGGGLAASLFGVGFLRLFNQFLAQPINKNMLKNAIKGGKDKKEAFMKKFLEYIPTVPDVPAAAVAVQPAVPFVSEQVQQQ
jgi:hypothetical protein